MAGTSAGILCACAPTQPLPGLSSPGTAACTGAGAASSSWPSPPPASGDKPAIVSAQIAGNKFTLTFAHGTPQFEVKPQSSAHFSLEPSGKSLDLPGSAGAVIVLRGFRGDVPNYTPGVPLASHGPILLEATILGDSEGVITWAAGLSEPGCAHVTLLGSTLTFQFIAKP